MFVVIIFNSHCHLLMNKFLDLIIVIYDYARWSLMYLNLKTGKKK
jgi:hypothetical protein